MFQLTANRDVHITAVLSSYRKSSSTQALVCSFYVLLKHSHSIITLYLHNYSDTSAVNITLS